MDLSDHQEGVFYNQRTETLYDTCHADAKVVQDLTSFIIENI